jgi:hypothetical protein
MIGREMDRWIFSLSSLVLRAKEIIDWWRLGKQGFSFIFIAQGKEALGEGSLKRFTLLFYTPI